MDDKEFAQARDETIKRGIHAEALLRSEEFTRTIQELEQTYMDSLIATDPDETKRRETYYFLNIALQSIVANLHARVAAYQQLREREAFEEELKDEGEI